MNVDQCSRRISDHVILARIADGDTRALGLLYNRYAPQLLRFASRIDPNDAPDVVQTVFLRMIRIAASVWPNTKSARPWLFAITTRVLQERSRRLRRWHTAQARLAELPGARTSSSTRLETSWDVQRGLMQLSLAKRTVVMLAEIEGLSCEEIANLLAIPVGTVYTRLHHARREMRAFHAAD